MADFFKHFLVLHLQVFALKAAVVQELRIEFEVERVCQALAVFVSLLDVGLQLIEPLRNRDDLASVVAFVVVLVVVLAVPELSLELVDVELVE